MNKNFYKELLDSATRTVGKNSLEEFHKWFSKKKEKGIFEVNQVPLNELDDWIFKQSNDEFFHKSGKFFKICGLEVIKETNEKKINWIQPILNQAEIGLLGLIAKKIDGILHFLIQAKMEPGNINLLQVSPTVQATKSNYTMVHGGRRPKFVEYFFNSNSGTILFDQLRSEQGTRYFRKRNRNIVLLLDEAANIPDDNDFFWLTLGQLQELHKIPNLIHLDCRSILGGMPFSSSFFEIKSLHEDKFSRNMNSLVCEDNNAAYTFRELLHWFTEQKVSVLKQTKLVSFKRVLNWNYDGISIKHNERHHFDVIGVKVHSPSREVASWSQPLIKNINGGIIGLISKQINGVPHFLIQARFEAGLIDSVELAPTVQFTPNNYRENELPIFSDIFMNNNSRKILVDTMLSDEGGRFYHSQQRHIVIELEDSESIKIPENFIWMNIGQLHQFGLMELTLNIELRSLIFCLSLND